MLNGKLDFLHSWALTTHLSPREKQVDGFVGKCRIWVYVCVGGILEHFFVLGKASGRRFRRSKQCDKWQIITLLSFKCFFEVALYIVSIISIKLVIVATAFTVLKVNYCYGWGLSTADSPVFSCVFPFPLSTGSSFPLSYTCKEFSRSLKTKLCETWLICACASVGLFLTLMTCSPVHITKQRNPNKQKKRKKENWDYSREEMKRPTVKKIHCWEVF